MRNKSRPRYTTGMSQISYIQPQNQFNYDYVRVNKMHIIKHYCIFLARNPSISVQICLHLGYEISRSECTNCKSFTNLYKNIMGEFNGTDE